MIEWLKEYDYVILLILVVALIWLYWLPRILSPILAPRYKNLPPSIKSFLALILPTVEEVILNSWDGLYTDVLVPIVDETPTPLDNEALEEINKLIQETLAETKEMISIPTGETNNHPPVVFTAKPDPTMTVTFPEE
jgi:hypothetical protein